MIMWGSRMYEVAMSAMWEKANAKAVLRVTR